jgi:hypothetical protein
MLDSTVVRTREILLKNDKYWYKTQISGYLGRAVSCFAQEKDGIFSANRKSYHRIERFEIPEPFQSIKQVI